MTNISLGTRISLNNYLATVRYIGPVDGTTGNWLGVEWDIPDRGKHSGAKDGKQYFTCRVPNAGSFIRPNANVAYGISFLEALRAKYIESLHGSKTAEKIVLGSSQGAIEVEAVDLDKIREKFRHLDRLREASLDGEGVSRADPQGQIRNTCPNIKGLDLSVNLFPSWEEVAKIASELPALERLALSRNRLSFPTTLDSLDGAFNHLLELQLNETLLTWSEMQAISAYMPRLQSVELGYNRLEALSGETPRAFNSGIQKFNLDGNHLSEWARICSSLKQYPSLQRLILTSNHIDAIPVPDDSQTVLPSIQHISLSDNPIRYWRAIDALSLWCPALKSLTMSGTPLVNDQNDGQSSRPFVIARIPSLMTLDGASISTRERTDSELFYLSSIMREEYADDAARAKAHPSWEALCKKHGRPEINTAKSSSQDKLSTRLREIQLINTATPSSDPLSLRVLPTMTLRNLRLKILKLLKLDPRKVQLKCYLRMGDGSPAEIESEYDTREIDWLGIEDASELLYEVVY